MKKFISKLKKNTETKAIQIATKAKFSEKKGATLIEYIAIVLVVVVLIGVIVFPFFTEEIENITTSVSEKLTTIINFSGN